MANDDGGTGNRVPEPRLGSVRKKPRGWKTFRATADLLLPCPRSSASSLRLVRDDVEPRHALNIALTYENSVVGTVQSKVGWCGELALGVLSGGADSGDVVGTISSRVSEKTVDDPRVTLNTTGRTRTEPTSTASDEPHERRSAAKSSSHGI